MRPSAPDTLAAARARLGSQPEACPTGKMSQHSPVIYSELERMFGMPPVSQDTKTPMRV
eukprot:gene5618-5581_t